jgi:HD-like signal output (HDOD) protein
MKKVVNLAIGKENAMSTENALLTILIERINNDSLVLPTLPEAALRVRKAADDPDINLNAMAEVISHDPALSARMIKIANSAFMGRKVKVETLNQAVTRIGLIQIKNIATALAMEQLFVSRNEVVKEFMQSSWSKTVDVATVSIAVMQHYLREHKNNNLRADAITLAALVYNIGVLPILTEAERHEEVFAAPEFLEHAIRKLAGKIGGKIMDAWGFTDDFRTIAENWRDLSHQPEQATYLDFVRIGALYHGELLSGAERDKQLLYYVDRGLLPDTKYFESDEFTESVNAIKTVFA